MIINENSQNKNDRAQIFHSVTSPCNPTCIHYLQCKYRGK
jgi:hypothetical protein